MGILANLRRKLGGGGGARPRAITGPLGVVRRCLDCHATLEVLYWRGNGNNSETVGLVCPACREWFEELVTGRRIRVQYRGDDQGA